MIVAEPVSREGPCQARPRVTSVARFFVFGAADGGGEGDGAGAGASWARAGAERSSDHSTAAVSNRFITAILAFQGDN